MTVYNFYSVRSNNKFPINQKFQTIKTLNYRNKQYRRTSNNIFCQGNRRQFLGIFVPFLGFDLGQDILGEQIPTRGDCPTCVGGYGDTLGSCAGIKNCLSTYDDRPGFFIAPWEYDCSQQDALKKLKNTLKTFNAQIVEQRDDYIYATFEAFGGQTDDVEFLFPSEDNSLSIRSASRSQRISDFGRNFDRLEQIRIDLGFEIVPVLRNRQRLLGVVESPFDTFGPEPPLGTDSVISGGEEFGGSQGSAVENILEQIENIVE
eukprot:TRINITY_DN9625_c0_g3_i3.p1 TRINITY_DN9625_c0_g3~~TRINITY_DN9625_c0_g3_i3.p1  ORF type:complete len:261 (-),score=38.55 TRINITY_DN9625_c0_g3_i3:242-1024(-)